MSGLERSTGPVFWAPNGPAAWPHQLQTAETVSVRRLATPPAVMALRLMVTLLRSLATNGTVVSRMTAAPAEATKVLWSISTRPPVHSWRNCTMLPVSICTSLPVISTLSALKASEKQV